MTNTEASVLLAESVVDNDSNNLVEIPVRSDGTEYEIDGLSEDQKESLAEVLHAVREYCAGRDVNCEKVLRITVSGVAGSGKSTWINTLVTSVRRIFNNNDSILVFAPTGSAAFNAGGQTLHRGFKVPMDFKDFDIPAGTQKILFSRYMNTIVIIIDERSMMDATVLGIIQYYMKKCAHGGKQKDHPWGGIPIIIFVGDDYQLPPIIAGAFYALHPEQLKQTYGMSGAKFEVRMLGFAEFLEMGKNVMYLEGEKRLNEGQDVFRQLLRAVRCEDGVGYMKDEEIETLLQLDLSHKKYTQKERREIEEEATYVFANKEPRDRLNSMKLKMVNLKNNPVARIRSVTVKPNGRRVSNQNHFDADRQPSIVLICKDARVTLNGVNPDPKNGLFHGSLGIIRDIVYDIDKSPNEGHEFPAYVLVEFYQYCGRELILNMPRMIPIVPQEVRCKIGCCSRKYMPLALAYGKTAHTFQGQNVGPVPPGRPENPIKRIIVDPGKRVFEGRNVGLFYQLLSRATTIGTPEDKLSSAIYFDGENFTRTRIQRLAMKNEKDMYKLAEMRKEWVCYLRSNEMRRGRWTIEEMNDLFYWANTTRIDEDLLTNIIESHYT